jgi:hypothetical protein
LVRAGQGRARVGGTQRRRKGSGHGEERERERDRERERAVRWCVVCVVW